MRLLAALILTAGLALLLPSGVAVAFHVGVQDQGVDAPGLTAAAGLLGASTVRIIARPGEPHVELVRAYRAAGLTVQAAIQLKRESTPGDVRGLLRAWAGQVSTVSIGNEPELNGVKACTYARLFRRASALIRREHPGVRVGFGELSPTDPLGYTRAVTRCPGPRLRADFWAVHPYQFHSDPLAPASYERSMGKGIRTWLGIGDLSKAHRMLHSRAVRSRLATPRGRALPIRATEFAYLITGGYATTAAKAATLWPRAIQQARRWTEQLIVYGLGPVHDTSSWGSAALIDRAGRRLPAFTTLARALGRTLPTDLPADVPPVVASGALPDGTLERAVPLAAPALVHAAADEQQPPAPVEGLELPVSGGQGDASQPETAPAPVDPVTDTDPGTGPTEPAPTNQPAEPVREGTAAS